MFYDLITKSPLFKSLHLSMMLTQKHLQGPDILNNRKLNCCHNVQIKCVSLCVHAQLCLTLCDPMDYRLPGFSVHWISQARILEWVAISSSMGSSQPRDWTCISCVSCTAVRYFTSEPLEKPLPEYYFINTGNTLHWLATWYRYKVLWSDCTRDCCNSVSLERKEVEERDGTV